MHIIGIGYYWCDITNSSNGSICVACCILFARSSERLDGWFKNTKLYRENNIKNGMTKQAKIRIMCSVTLLMSVGFIMMGLKGIVVGNVVLLIVWIFHMAYFTFGVKTV